MHNIFRFIIGFAVTFFLIVVLCISFLIFSPIIFGVTFVSIFVFAVGAIVYAIILFFVGIWYFFRNEPKTKKTVKSVKFSIKQGREI